MDEELVTIRTYRFPADAEADRMHLETQEIPAVLANENVTTWEWLLNEVKLQVPQSYAEVALKILDMHAVEHTLFDAPAEPAEALRCLSCGERMLKDEAQCPACGWSYADAVEQAPAEKE